MVRIQDSVSERVFQQTVSFNVSLTQQNQQRRWGAGGGGGEEERGKEGGRISRIKEICHLHLQRQRWKTSLGDVGWFNKVKDLYTYQINKYSPLQSYFVLFVFVFALLLNQVSDDEIRKGGWVHNSAPLGNSPDAGRGRK